jgi:flavin-dependent dehydrogenase
LKVDVAVVGASSAGLFAATRLAAAGRRVVVFEQRPALAYARRTLIVTPQIRQMLGYEPPVLHRIKVMTVATPGAELDVRFSDPDLIVERGAVMLELAHRTEAAGASIQLGARLRAITPHADGALLRFSGPGGPAEIVAGAVIGADGVAGHTALAAGIGHPPSVPILQAEISLPDGWDPQVAKCWFDRRETRFFYWLMAEGHDRAVLGLVGDDPRTMRGLVDGFVARQGWQTLAYQGARVAMYDPRFRPWGTVGHAPVLLVGDAAGHVKVTTVGGSVTGFWGAAAAAESLLTGTHYAQTLRPLDRELRLHWLVRVTLDWLDNSGYDRLLHAVPPQVCRFLGHNNRDQMAGALWRELIRQPSLLSLGPQLLGAGLARRFRPGRLV